MNIRLNAYIIFLIIVFGFSCRNDKTEYSSLRKVKVIRAEGFQLPIDSLVPPIIKLVDKTKLKKVFVNKPKSLSNNSTTSSKLSARAVLAGKPRVCIPGNDTFLLPKRILVVEKPLIAGLPQNVIAKDAYIKDDNYLNFYNYSKLQGLNHGSVRCMLQDRIGNIWFGTEGGVSKFDGKSFTTFTEKEGLAQNFVWSILEDKANNIWFGTDGGGVSKYDGITFTTFTTKEGLASNSVNSMLQDRLGNIWFGTYGGGVTKYDGSYFSTYTDKEGLVQNSIWSILQDKAGNIWFGTEGGVSKYDGKGFANYTESEGLANNAVWSLLEDNTGNLWFGTDGGISKYNGKTFTTYTEKEGLAQNSVWSIHEDDAKNLWFGTDGGGVSKFDGKSFINYTDKDGLANNIVNSIFGDNSGNIWFGTYGGGVSKINRTKFNSITVKDGLAQNRVYSILQDKAGNIWFGTESGGASSYDGNNFITYNQKSGLPDIRLYSMIEDRSGNIWFGTLYGGVSEYNGSSFTTYTSNDGLALDAVLSILQDKSGNLWFATSGKGASKYDGKAFTTFSEKQGLANNFVTSILQDRIGNVWFGTNEGVSRLDAKYLQDQAHPNLIAGPKAIFTNFTIREGLISNNVLSILEDKSGNIWIGTESGVSLYNGTSFINITDNEGLSNNAVLGMIEDRHGNIWFATRHGLSMLSKRKFSLFIEKVNSNGIKDDDVFFKNFTYDDGFLGYGCIRHAIYETKDGKIWIGTNDRLTLYNPSLIDLQDTMPPNIQLKGLQLFNEDINWSMYSHSGLYKDNMLKQVRTVAKDTNIILGNGVYVSDFKFDSLSRWYNVPQNLSLAYNNNFISFNFIGISMNQPKSVKYKYKLEGIDNGWSALTTRTDATYGNLPHGNYIFKVKAMNADGYWSEPLLYTFTIRAPWWLTNWFKGLVVLFVVCSIWIFIKWRERKLKVENEYLELTVKERTNELVKKNIVVEEQKKLVEEKHREITDSINYAERIQRSFMATKELLDDNLKDYFVLFQPKDVVSGDFYWASKLNNGRFALVTADSTGHGVPGAIMSLLNIASLEKSIENESEPSKILNNTRKIIIERLKKDGSADGGKDGMDCSVLSFDFTKLNVVYSGANNPVWIVRTGTHNVANELLELEPDKMPVGKHDKDAQSFNQLELPLQKGDVIYTLTDGYPDQFGGPKGKKFMYKKLKELLLSIANKPMEEQKKILQDTLTNWKGSNEQVDDITVIGVRMNVEKSIA